MREPLIENDLKIVILGQIVHELYNSNLYLRIESFLKSKGLENISKHFHGQVEEERGHAGILVDLLTALDCDVTVGEIPSCEMGFNTPMDIAQAYLDREILTTRSLQEIKDLAMSQDNGVVEERIREMVKLQQNEYEEATTFMDKVELTGNDWKFVFLWDTGLG